MTIGLQTGMQTVFAYRFANRSSCVNALFVNQWTVAAGGDVVRDYGRWWWLQTFSHRRRGTSLRNLGGLLVQNDYGHFRRMNAARRWRSDAPAKPHRALEACINLAATTERKIVCSETSSMPWARKTLRADKVCALELITAWTCSATERLFVKVTPRIFRVVTRAMSGSGGGGWCTMHVPVNAYLMCVQFLTVCDCCELRTNKLWNCASADALSV